MSLRDDLRSKALQSRTQQRKLLTFNGAEIEMIQPKLEWIVTRDPEKNINIVDYLINFARVPGTDEAVFEEADRAVLLDLPFDRNMKDVVEAINTLTGVDIAEARKNSLATS